MSVAGQGREMRWTVNGLELAGLSWGEPGGCPLLALHGWLDNAASFAVLGPLLQGCEVVALDLPGQGRSAHRSADASYQIWDDLPEILGVADALGWDSFCLLGHSRGAIISTLLASAFPERVQQLVLLDAVSPQALPQEEFPRQMRRALRDKVALLARQARVFADTGQAIATRTARGLGEDAAALLVPRSLRACAGGQCWTTDARLHGASPVKLSEAQIEAMLQALDMPTLLLLAAGDESSPGRWMQEHARRHIASLQVAEVPGGHHFHMEAQAAEVARHVLEFMTAAQGAAG